MGAKALKKSSLENYRVLIEEKWFNHNSLHVNILSKLIQPIPIDIVDMKDIKDITGEELPFIAQRKIDKKWFLIEISKTLEEKMKFI